MSPQSKRLKVFIDSTGMSLTEFGKQCKIKSSSSLHNVISVGKTPSAKLLDKIVKRFPQLNHDWVLLGYGEMIVKGIQNQPATSNSLQKTQTATFQNIQEYLENHDYALNYLANKVEKAILSTTKTFQQVNDRLNVFEQKIEIVNLEVKQNWKKYEAKIDTELGEFGKTIENEFTAIREDSLAARAERFKLTNELDDKRLKFLHDKFEEVKADLKSNSDANTQKAINFVSEIGKYNKHSNPKPEK